MMPGPCSCSSISGLVAEYIVAIDVTRVRKTLGHAQHVAPVGFFFFFLWFFLKFVLFLNCVCVFFFVICVFVLIFGCFFS